MIKKVFQTIAGSIAIASVFVAILSFNNSLYQTPDITGAWQVKNGDEEKILLLQDRYFSETSYSTASKKFFYTRGGTYETAGAEITVGMEFDSRKAENIGRSVKVGYAVKNDKLEINLNNNKETWTRVDNGKENLAGTWKITGRLQEGQIVPIHQTGARKTVKILTSSRFQWAAINPETKEFFGTGGGTYSFKNGKYTENIEFFSRDSSRVGASLSFDGKLENGEWHHSGLSSRGDKIYEIWKRAIK